MALEKIANLRRTYKILKGIYDHHKQMENENIATRQIFKRAQIARRWADLLVSLMISFLNFLGDFFYVVCYESFN